MKSIKRLYLPQKFSDPLAAEKKGQSLVEFAIVVPILLLLLLGVFEVGYGLRNYLALANVNREATRFAARGIYLDFDEKSDPNAVGYEKVVSHTLQSLAGQLGMDILGTNPNGVQLITFYRIQPENFGCPGDPTCASFDCSRFDYENRDDASFVAGETLNNIEYPYLWSDNSGDPDMPPYYETALTIANTTAISSYYYYRGANDVYSRIDPGEMVVELRSRSNLLNCDLVKKKQPPTNSDYVVVENIFFQKPLVGLLPFVGDSIPMYTHTVMRVTGDIRKTNAESEPSCELYPIMIPASKVSGLNQGDSVKLGIASNAGDFNMPGNFGFVHWKSSVAASTGNQSTSLPNNMLNPANAANDFEEPDTGCPSGANCDTSIEIGDWVEAYTGVNTAVKDELGQLQAEGTYMRMPVWFDGDCDPALPTGSRCSSATGTGGSDSKYRIMTFVVMKIVQEQLPQFLRFEFDHFEPSACVATP